MRVHWLAKSLLVLAMGACRQEGDIFTGTYQECLCKADLGGLVELDKQTSLLTMKLFHEGGRLAGEVILDGEVAILGSDIEDDGDDPYPLHDLELRGRILKGKIDVPDFLLTPSFRGEFRQEHQILLVTVRRLGEIALARVDEPDKVPDSSDTGVVLE